MVHDNDQALQNVLRMVQEKAIVSLSGKRIPCAVDSICVHGDSAGAVAMARHVRAGLEKAGRSEEHTSELQSLMRISYAVFCLKKKINTTHILTNYTSHELKATRIKARH